MSRNRFPTVEAVRSMGHALLAAFVMVFGPGVIHASGQDRPRPPLDAGSFPVSIRIDATKTSGEMRPVWRYFGYDEPNYTYMKDGQKLLGQLRSLSSHAVSIRAHNLLTSGDGQPALKWGSTGVYTEDDQGRPHYNWTILDHIFDTYLERGVRPYVQIGFMPEALSTHPRPYKHDWTPGGRKSISTGWAYPPKDYTRWGELVFQWVRHCAERYGQAEVEQWYWEVWNEPNIFYWRGTSELRGKPIIIGESDPDGCAACPATIYPQNGYRNGTLYASYTAASFARKYLLADKHGVNFEGAVTWAFEFEDQPYFAGFRVLSTNGIPLPVLNVFRMFGMMGGQRLAVESSCEVSLEAIRKEGVRGKPDISALASLRNGKLCVLVWHYHDDDVPGPPAEVEVSVSKVPDSDRPVLLQHFRIDQYHSNAFEAWKRMGAPPQPTPEQYAGLERSSHLSLLTSPEWVRPESGKLTLRFSVPRQAVSLLVFER